MARNKLVDLNNHLFEQMERLNDEELSVPKLEIEMKRAKAMSGIARQIVENAKLALEAEKFLNNDLPRNRQLPEQLKKPGVLLFNGEENEEK